MLALHNPVQRDGSDTREGRVLVQERRQLALISKHPAAGAIDAPDNRWPGVCSEVVCSFTILPDLDAPRNEVVVDGVVEHHLVAHQTPCPRSQETFREKRQQSSRIRLRSVVVFRL